MMRVDVRLWGIVCLLAGAVAVPSGVRGYTLDKDGTIKLGVRTYASARVGTEHTDITNTQEFKSLTFPVSDDGHLRQSRFFIEAEFDHDLVPLMKKNFGPFALLNDLPFRVSTLKYHLVYRGEYEGVYDYGPSEYRNNDQFFDDDLIRPGTGRNRDAVSTEERQRLREIASHRERLFQAFVDVQMGELFLRVGRQILAWGETDAFRLLDNINPTDSSFGGFLISLDERRVPLDMLRANYYFGDFGPVSELFAEAFVAIDDEVGFNPGIPAGSPWGLPNVGAPSTVLYTRRETPSHTFEDARGGGLIKFNLPLPKLGSGTFSLSHYYTYFDTPAVQTFVCPDFPISNCNITGLNLPAGQGDYLALAVQSAPRVQVTGASTTFAIPSAIARYVGIGSEPIIRGEVAYFKGEPRFSQYQLDPFLYKLNPDPEIGSETVNGKVTGGKRTGDSWNAVLGVDINQWIRFLNPNQTFFISTQFFYKHLNGAAKRRRIGSSQSEGFCEVGDPSIPDCEFYVSDGEVLPVPEFNQAPPSARSLGAVQSVLVHNPVDQYLQTLLIATSYYSSQINPSMFMAYDWSGAWVVGPGVTFSRDPFRFRIEYNYLYAGRYKGGSGISLLRDRDNVLFQFEYVI